MRKTAEKFITAEEYFEMEELAEYKNEYYHGEIFAMSGASNHHNIIFSNVIGNLYALLKNSDCFVYGSDMKIELDKARHYAYSDVSIVCGDVEFTKGRNDVITNPIVIIEILSESTADYDKDGKFKAYQNIKTLKDYILIDQYSYGVEYFYKNRKGEWILQEFKNIKDSFFIKSVKVRLSLEMIYYRVNL